MKNAMDSVLKLGCGREQEKTMKKKVNISLFLLPCLLAMMAIMGGCKKDGEDTSTPGSTKTQGKTEATVITASPQPTVSETSEPTAENPPLTGDQLGKPQTDSVIVFEDRFEDNLEHPDVLFRSLVPDGRHEIVDEQLCMSILGGEPVDVVESYSPKVYCEVTDNVNQYEFFVTFKSEHPQAENWPWMACFVGIRVYEPTGGEYRPNDDDSGLYVAFTQYGKAVLYHGNHTSTGKAWHEGVVSMDLPKGFQDMQTLAIVDTGKSVFFYIKEGEQYTLFLRVDFSDDKLTAYDKADEVLYEAENNLKENAGGYLKVFNHFARTVVDSVVIKKR